MWSKSVLPQIAVESLPFDFTKMHFIVLLLTVLFSFNNAAAMNGLFGSTTEIVDGKLYSFGGYSKKVRELFKQHFSL